MDFESPDVEKEFPGLYASESAKKSNESDCTYYRLSNYLIIFARQFPFNSIGYASVTRSLLFGVVNCFSD